ncbi:AMP-binding protein [Pseudozobellia sp. WGM2]|uniref:AMP-binding protein n=1 Tax=Pseudozobellia sp. WGM2 TaxID=2787625 RepID=UPI001AE0A53C|nr:AMP-binding protein [Pseudozobellia sp. WGM2]
MTHPHKTLHNRFRLQGSSYNLEELKEIAYSLVKEGEVYEIAIGDFLLDWLNDKLTLTVQTSGSTGAPKTIVLEKEKMLNSTKATGDFFNLKEGNTALLCLSADYIAGKMMLVRAMVLGLELDYVSPTSKPIGKEFESHDFCAMVPLQVANSLDELKNIKKLIVGGSPMNQELKTKIKDRGLKTEIFETYGMTETITHIAVKKVHPVETENIVFKTLPGVAINTDERDCLVIDAPLVSDDIISTNDIVRIVSNTEFEWLGRYDNVINSGGVKLFPEQIEHKLHETIKARFFVAGLPDDILGQKLVLVVEGNTATDQLLEKIKQLTSLDKYEVPKQIFTVPKFKETDSGKVQRKKTLEQVK